MFADFFIDNIPCISPKSLLGSLSQLNWPLHNHSEANGVYCYRGRRPSEAHLLVPKSFVDAMDQSIAHTIRISHDGGELSLPGWYVYKCEAAGQGDGTDDNQIFYLQLRDARQIGEATVYTTASADIISTLRYNTTSNETQPSTTDWQDVLDALWAMLPALGKAASSTCPTLATTPSSKAENLTFEGLSVWHAISKTLNACGHYATLDPVTRQYAFEAYGDTQSGLSALRSSNLSLRIWEGQQSVINGLNYPENIKIVFVPERSEHRHQAPWGKPYVRTVATGASNVITGTTWGIVDASRKERNAGETEDDDPANKTQLDNRATDLARYIKGVFACVSSPKCIVYQGIVRDFRVGQQLTEVAWVNDRRGVYTYTSTHGKVEFDLPSNIPEMLVANIPYDTAVAYTSGGATARSGTTLGSGTATLQKIVSGVISDLEDEDNNDITVTFYNLSTSAVSTGYILICRELVTGMYIVVWEDC